MKVSVLFVCLGNICRSPLAEAVFRYKVEEKGIDEFFLIDSAGTSNYHIGELADIRNRRNAESNNLKIVHRARQISQEDLLMYDYILAMDRKNFNNILALSGEEHQGKFFLMRSFSPYIIDTSSKEIDVPDPYYGGEDGFEKVYDILDKSCENLLDFLIRQHL